MTAKVENNLNEYLSKKSDQLSDQFFIFESKIYPSSQSFAIFDQHPQYASTLKVQCMVSFRCVGIEYADACFSTIETSRSLYTWQILKYTEPYALANEA